MTADVDAARRPPEVPPEILERPSAATVPRDELGELPS